MNSVLPSNAGGLIKYSKLSWFLSLLLITSSQLCRADSFVSNPATGSPDKWVSGPDKASLGANADIQIPKGYRFIGTEGAETLLQRMGNPVTPGLIGILSAESGNWWAVLEYHDLGYVKDVDDKKPDLDAILRAVQSKNVSADGARVSSVEWQVPPAFNSGNHSLEWEFIAQTPGGKIVNHTIALLSRSGVLDITTIRPMRNSRVEYDLDPLNEMVKNITFKEGQRYGDYQRGDKLATADIQRLVVGDETSVPEGHGMVARSSRNIKIWGLSAAGGGVVIVGCVVLLSRRSRKRKSRAFTYSNHRPTPAPERNGARNGVAVNGNGASRQKKMFNYQKFYTDVLLELSGHSYAWVGNSSSNGNGNGNGKSAVNGSSNGSSNGHAEPRTLEMVKGQETDANQAALANANAELIACQRNLIQEQKNLMREQSRIIEEKAKLIEEYNQLTEKWTKDIENQFSLKLD